MKLFFLALTLIFSTSLSAAKVEQGDYKNRQDVELFIDKMTAQSDYTEQELVALFSSVIKQGHLFDRLDRPAEKALEWYQYRRIFIKDSRINQGIEFWKEHKKLLTEVSSKTGVPAEIIIAIIGVETFYGTYRGKDPVFDSLVTLAFDYPKRAKFFTQELEQFLLLTKEQKLDTKALVGSYAGAMGMPQFIASSYRHYAVDFDNDGQVNLFDSKPDIFASVANYFVKHGWRTNEAIAGPLAVNAINSIDQLQPGVKTDYKWADFSQHGLMSNTELAADTPVALIKLEQTDHSEYWVGFENFYVITRYNHSELYAMAVYQLSLLIKAGMN
ncbi:MAG: membrane-bound lytic murein transglycosylase B [Gammaproteobacteria bacterium]|jgi:membrane-bound lytic murein transglycosylase B